MARLLQRPAAHPAHPAALLLLIAVFVSLAAAATTTTTSATATSAAASSSASTTASPTVYNASTAPTTAPSVIRQYAYLGCFLEVSGENGTAPGSRTMQQGTDEVLPGEMTVFECLRFCGTSAENSTAGYTYAGLEYARECWCGADMSGLATQEPETDCNLACEGNTSTLCGGSMRLTVYKLSPTSGASMARVAGWALAMAAGAATLQLL